MDLNNEVDILCKLLSCINADGRQVSHVMIEEKDKLAKLKKLCISDLCSGMLLLATDEGRKRKMMPNVACMSPLFSDREDSYGQNCACDAVLLKVTSNEIHLCYLDLKSDNPTGYENQFKSTRAFMRYVICLIKEFCNIELNITKENFVVFHTDSRNVGKFGKKPKTRFNPTEGKEPNNPIKFCVRNGDEVRYTQFFG